MPEAVCSRYSLSRSLAASRYWLVRRARHIRAVVVSALALRQVHATETPASQHDGEGRDDEQWFFSVVDIIAALTDSGAPTKYWTAMKRREETASGFQLSTICRQLKLTSSDGKTYETDCVNTEAAFRIIQSIPRPKAEPFKRWLAAVGYQRVQKIENPERAQQRMRALYEEKGYPDGWIEKRVRGIAVRDELTGERQKRGIADQQDFAILTAEISPATFNAAFAANPIRFRNKAPLAPQLPEVVWINQPHAEALTQSN